MPIGLEEVRKICLGLPDVEERLSHGEPAWFIRKGKLFAMFADEHHDNRIAVWIAAPPGVQEALVQSEPGRYFRPPYVGVKGWVGAYLDVPVDWAEVANLLTAAQQFVMPHRLRGN